MPIYSIQGPDGKTYSIEGPEGATREQVITAIQTRMQSQPMGPAPEPQPVAPPPPPTGGFMPAVARGFLQTGSLLGDILPAMAARAVGADEYAEKQFKEAKETEEKIQRLYPAAVPSFKDIAGVGDAVTYLTESVGELIPSIIPSIFTGGAAGLLSRGATIAAKEAAEKAARDIALKEGAETLTKAEVQEQIKNAGVQAALKTALKYDATGAVAGSALLNIPEVYQNIKEQTGEESIGSAIMFGGFNSLLDAALPVSLLAKARKAGIPNEQIVGEWYKRFGKGALKGFATEGATEAAQEMSSAAAEKFVDNNQEFFSERNLERFINAGLKGGLGGGVVSGSMDVVTGKRPPTQDELIKELRPGESLEQGINRVYSELNNSRAVLNELKQDQAESGRTRLNADALGDLGFDSKDPLYGRIVDKDINDPQQASEVIEVLKAGIADPNVSDEMKGLYSNTIETINQYTSSLGEPDVGLPVGAPGGEGVGVAGVPSGVPATEGVEQPQRTGVVPSLKDVEQVVGGTGVEQPALTPEAAPEAPAPEPEIDFATLIPQQEERVTQLTNQFQTLLKEQINRFGLKDVAVKVNADLRDANGLYSKGLIQLAIDADDPVRDIRHESIHALKELGFFSDAQWNTLVNTARTKWIDEFMRNRNVSGGALEPGGKSRYDAYVDVYTKQGMSAPQIEEALIEEAIADAFGSFAKNKPPPGLMSAILNRMRNFFQAIKNTFKAAPPDTAEAIFGKISKGELKGPAKAVKTEAAPEVKETAAPEAKVPAKEAAASKQEPKAPEPAKPSIKEAKPSVSQPSSTLKEDIKFSLKASKEFFDRAEKIPESESVEAIRESWIGGVSGIGDRDLAYNLPYVDGGKEYTKRVQDFIRKELGDTFQAFRLMSNDELEELTTGAMGTQLTSFTFNRKVAEAFKNIPSYTKRKDLVVVEMDFMPDHVQMLGHPGEQEIVIDYGVGYNPSNIRVVKTYGETEEKVSKAPEEKVKPNQWKSDAQDIEQAEEYAQEYDFMPYTSEGQLSFPVDKDGPRYSIKAPYSEKQIAKAESKGVALLKNDPVTGLPLNKNGTVTLYFPTTNDGARELARTKTMRGHSPEATRIYLTNESSAGAVLANPGSIEQPVGGANVLLQIDPSMLQLAAEYENGRKDFFIPIAEGQYFAKKAKMTKMFTLFADRKTGLHPDRTLAQVTEAIQKAANRWSESTAPQKNELYTDAKNTLIREHNVSNLFGANAKLEKTNIGDYGLTFNGKKVMSTGLGFASAQKINDKSQENTCPKRAICEDLCLGETSGQNELYGGEGPYRSGPRLAQFLKSEAFIVNPEAFTTSLIRQIERFKNAAQRAGYHPALRLNVTSDFPGKMFKPVMDLFPDVTFYDYTKLITAKPVAPNHYLTYSSTGASQVVNDELVYNKESNWDQIVDKVLPNGMNVAMAFTSRSSMPKFIMDERTNQTFEVWNGDEYDARFLDPKREDGKGWIIGLTNKDRTVKPEQAAKERNGFFLDYDPERDGDTLVIRDQKKLAAQRAVPVQVVMPSKIPKPSLRQQKTQEFIQWFGDSKITNPDGSPMIMYHGTAMDIKAFKPFQAGAIFITSDPDFASGFTDTSLKWRAKHIAQFLKGPEIRKALQILRADIYDDYGKQSRVTKGLMEQLSEAVDKAKETGRYDLPGELGERWVQAVNKVMPSGPNVMPVYIKADKPFDYENRTHVKAVIRKIADKYYMETVETPTKYKRVGKALIPVEAPEKQKLVRDETYDEAIDFFEKKYLDKLTSGNWEAIENDPEVMQAIKDLKFDAFYVKEEHTEGPVKNLAVFNPDQVKSATGNIGTFGQRPPTEAEAGQLGLTQEEAVKAQKEGDTRFSLRSFNRNQLPKNKEPYTLPAGTILYHGAYKSVADAIDSVGYLMSRPKIKAHGGATNEGGLVWFGGEDTARDFANSKADPFSVELDRKAGIVREPGKVFEAVTDKPYKLIDRNHVLNKAQAEKLNDVLGLPDYKSLKAGDGVNIAALRAHDYSNSNAPRYKVKSKGVEQEMSAPYPLIFEALGVDGFYDNGTVALSAKEGIKLGELGQPMARFSVRSQVDPAITARMEQTTTAREQETFAKRITEAFSPEARSKFRAAFLNRYNRLGEYDKMKLERSGGMDLYADVTAEGAALLSDLGAGILASAFGVHDRVGGAPVYKKQYIVQKMSQNGMFTQVGGTLATRAQADKIAKRYGGTVREKGYVAVSNFDNTIKGPIAIFAPLQEKYKDPEIFRYYQYWAGVKRGSKYMAVRQPDGSYKVEEKLFEKKDIDKARKLEKDYPEFIQVQKEWRKYNDKQVQFMLATGVINAEQAAKFTEHGDYMPFYRQADGADDAIGPRIFQSISGVQAPKKIKHGEDPLGDFFENMVRNSQSAIQAGLKNIAARRAADVGMDVGTVQRLAGPDSGPNVFYVMENGEKVYYDTSDILFVEAIKSLGLPNVPFIGILAAPANVLRNLVTKDPGFMLANMLRDSLSAYATSGVNMTPIAATLANFGKALAGKSPELDVMYKSGVLGGYDYSQNVMDSARQFESEIRKQSKTLTKAEKAMRPATYLWEALEKGTAASDAATRIEVFKDTLAKTNNEAEALFRSLEVMNFNRKGSNPIVRIATAAIPFLNARMQGLDVLYRAGFGANATQNAKEIQKAFFVRGMTMAALSTVYWMLTHDDEEYKKQEQEVRDNNWLFPSLGIRIPIPFEVGVLFKVIPERIAGLTFGDDTLKDFNQSMIRQLTSTFGLNPIPQAVLPIVETMTNYSFFTGRPIVSKGLEDVAPAFQVGPGTSRIAEEIGAATKGLPTYLQISPAKLDQLINGYTGTMGMYMVNLMDSIYDLNSDKPKPSMRVEQYPVIKRFMLDKEARGQVTAYYDLKNSVDTATRTSNLLEKTGQFEDYGKYMTDNMNMLATKDYVLDMYKTLKEMNDMKVMIRSSQMDGKQKREVLDQIQAAENQLTSNIQVLKKQMSKQ